MKSSIPSFGSQAAASRLHAVQMGAMVLLIASLTFLVAPQRLSAWFVPRIVNGVLTHDYPAVGAVLRGDFANWNQHIPITADNAGMFCSGTLIGCRTFLTAGHCTKTALPPGKLDADEAWVYLQHAGIFTVTSIALHPAYTLAGPGVPINDVAVLKLGAPVTGIAPMAINLADPNPFIPAAGTIVGFGNTGGEGAVDKGIKRVGHVETTTCLADLSPEPDTQLVCWDFLDPIGPPGADSDACGGDSGGPLLLDLGNGPVIAGLTSSGTNASCLPPDHSFDANVYTYRDFILAELGTDDTTTCGGLPPVGDPQVEVVGFDGRLDEATPSVTHEVTVAAGKNSARFGLNALETLLRNKPVRTFDVNMYVKTEPGASPTDFDCKADASSVFAACVFDLPDAATYSVFLQRVIGAGDYQLTVTVFGGAPPECGNGTVEFNEQCDDGNTAGGDCCAADCRFEPQGSNCGTAGVCDGAGQCGAIWTSHGPEGGDVCALAIDPQTPKTLYAGSCYAGTGHGAFKSTDGGDTWANIDIGLPEGSGIDALAVDPQAPETVYASTRSSGCSGLFKSADRGGTWSATAPYNSCPGEGGHVLAVDPVAPATVYVGVGECGRQCAGGAYKSTDGGDTWTALTTVLSRTGVFALATHPTTPTTLYAGTGEEGVFESTDGGDTWVNVLNSLPVEELVQALALDPATPTTLYASTRWGAGVFKTTDGGEHWSASGLTSLDIRALAIDPLAPGIVYAGTNGAGVFKSSDSGETWSPLNQGLTNLGVSALALDPGSPRRLYAGTAGGVFAIEPVEALPTPTPSATASPTLTPTPSQVSTGTPTATAAGASAGDGGCTVTPTRGSSEGWWLVWPTLVLAWERRRSRLRS